MKFSAVLTAAAVGVGAAMGAAAAAAVLAMALPAVAWADAALPSAGAIFLYQVAPLVGIAAIALIAVGVLIFVVLKCRKR